ncbi:MAG: SsrA-binding protein, partial [Polynucleobacter victoriensis]
RKWHCYSTRHNNLEYAKRSASEMYDEIRFKEKMGLGRGKKQHDKREASKDRDWQIEKARIMRSGSKIAD